MHAQQTRPTGQTRTFDANDIIVSKTDLKGRITYANEVFQRVSGYAESELVGKPHNLVRHPDMPGGVFRLMWEVIASGREIFAYVNNLARDGANYWVLAHVTPTFGADGAILGYHSNRRRPEQSAINQANALYTQMRTVEQGHGGAAAAAQASHQWLLELLAGKDTTYDEFVWDLIATSMAGVRA